jgi:RNA polymerase sigma-70 factor (sigma-E family)
LAFPERLLSEDEELIYDLRPHWLTLVVPVLLTVAVVVAVGAAWVVMPAGDLQQPARMAVGVIGLAVLLATVVGRVLRWATTHFVLTTERLIFRSGVVAKFGREIPLERINDVTFSQSLFERMIGAGDLLLESAGEHGQSRFSNIRDPEAVQLEIYRQMEANDRRRAGYATTRPHPAAADRTPTPPGPPHPPANSPRRPGAPGRPPRPRRRHRGGVPAYEARAAGPDVAGGATFALGGALRQRTQAVEGEVTGADLQFREFFAAEYGRLRGLGYLLTSDWGQAEELAQDALVRTYRAWPRVRGHDRPGAYARKVLVNRHRSLLRRAKVEARHLAGRRVEEAVQPELGTDGLVLWSAVRRLPARQRAVLVLRYHQDLPEAEVARLLGLPLGTVKSLAHRGLARLRAELGSPAMEEIRGNLE